MRKPLRTLRYTNYSPGMHLEEMIETPPSTNGFDVALSFVVWQDKQLRVTLEGQAAFLALPFLAIPLAFLDLTIFRHQDCVAGLVQKMPSRHIVP